MTREGGGVGRVVILHLFVLNRLDNYIVIKVIFYQVKNPQIYKQTIL